eukprot:7691352-Ditylum_brightwellii.AAC.1
MRSTAHDKSDRGRSITISILDWSDNIDPYSSIKSNHVSIWVKTVSIGVGGKQLHTSQNTYCIAIGSKDSNHEEVEEKFNDKMKMLASPGGTLFYYGKLKKLVCVYVHLYAALQDQPEKRGANYLMIGSSKFHGRWGYICNVVEVKDEIPSCRRGFELLMKGDDKQDYIECVNWDICNQSGKVDYNIPEKFPPLEKGTLQKLTPQKLSYSLLKTVGDIANNGLIHGNRRKE